MRFRRTPTSDTTPAACPTPAKDAGPFRPPSTRVFQRRCSALHCSSASVRVVAPTLPIGFCRPCVRNSAATPKEALRERLRHVVPCIAGGPTTAPYDTVFLGEFEHTVILTDGDVVFQPRKVQRSGLWDAVAGRVLIYIHKERMLDAVQRHYPARHYVMVDDKLRILAAMKKVLKDRLTTVFPRQGRYALDPAAAAAYPAADISIERIGDLLAVDIRELGGSKDPTPASQETP